MLLVSQQVHLLEGFSSGVSCPIGGGGQISGCVDTGGRVPSHAKTGLFLTLTPHLCFQKLQMLQIPRPFGGSKYFL